MPRSASPGQNSPLEAFLAAWRRETRAEARTDRVTRLLYATDASLYHVLPTAVLFPRHPEEVEAAVRLAARHRIPLLPRGAGTSLAGQAVNAAVVLDLSRYLNRILAVDPEARRVRVQPGVVLERLQAALARHGLRFGPDPASADRCTLGGMVANNATGARSIRYGTTADHLHALQAVLADGTVARLGAVDPGALAQGAQRPGALGALYRLALELRTRHAPLLASALPRHWRRAGGYLLDRVLGPEPHLGRLLAGSEGTLAVWTELELNLVPVPEATGLALLPYPTLRAALEAVPALLQTEPAAVELLDRHLLRLCDEAPGYRPLLRRVLGEVPAAVLLVLYEGSPAEVRAGLEALARRAAPARLIRAETPEAQAAVWTIRQAGLGLLMRAPGPRKPIPGLEDAAVPVETLPSYIEELLAAIRAEGTEAALYAHASAGCLHVRPFLDPGDPADVARLQRLQRRSLELVRARGGVMASEHGDGRARSWLNEAFFGPDLYGLFRTLKATLDPQGILNPGIVVDGPPPSLHLRPALRPHALPLTPALAYAPDPDLATAVDRCNGAGVCRRVLGGGMCPSFRVTGEEEDSTRGRANAWRALLAGELPLEALGSDRLARVFDLCVECKACKTECPSGVDMARLKTEFLAHHRARRGVPLRARFFAAVPAAARLGAGPQAPLLNALLLTGPGAALLRRFLGLAPRPLPRFARRPFRWRSRREGGEPVLLFRDTFTRYFEPQVARAAARLLEAEGFHVLTLPHGCCGRPHLSQGLLEAARARARSLSRALAPALAAGLPIVGLEPSCVLTIRDDYPALLPREPAARRLAERVALLQEFLAERLTTRPDRGEVLLHLHCHERALVGEGPTRKLLARAGFRSRLAPAGCCGLAGAFGYEREHFRWSLAMGEDGLLPAVRAAPELLVLATGFSCRQQIAFATGRRARHPVEVVAEGDGRGGRP